MYHSKLKIRTSDPTLERDKRKLWTCIDLSSDTHAHVTSKRSSDTSTAFKGKTRKGIHSLREKKEKLTDITPSKASLDITQVSFFNFC